MLHCICQELKKNLYLSYSLPAILGIICIALSAPGRTDLTGNEISIFSMLFSEAMQYNKSSNVLNIEQSSLILWSMGTRGWMEVLCPFLVSFGYITILSSERKDKFTQFHLIRSGKWQYCVSKVLSAALTGGFVFLAGYALFGLLLLTVFPSFYTFPQEQQSVYLGIWGCSVAKYVLKRLFGSFLYGMYVSIAGTFVTIVFRDKYMLLCLPFLMSYIYGRLLNKLETDDLACGGKYNRLIQSFLPSSMLNTAWDTYYAMQILFLTAVYLCLAVFFYLTIKRRYCGD